jgi:hypothetical protein
MLSKFPVCTAHFSHNSPDIIHAFFNGSTALCWALADFSVLYFYRQSVGLLGRGIIQSQGRYLHTEQHKHRINAQTSMPRAGFEPTIPEFERAIMVHALERAAIVIGVLIYMHQN